MDRLDICHKHHKQRLCKIILLWGKISHGEEISCVISKIFDDVDMAKWNKYIFQEDSE